VANDDALLNEFSLNTLSLFGLVLPMIWRATEPAPDAVHSGIQPSRTGMAAFVSGALLSALAYAAAWPLAASRSSSSARIVTPRLQAYTPCTTPSFRTSMISSTVARALNALWMWRCVPTSFEELDERAELNDASFFE
jgi:hypothetical protein